MYLHENVSETNMIILVIGLLLMTTLYLLSPYRFCFMCFEFHKKGKDGKMYKR